MHRFDLRWLGCLIVAAVTLLWLYQPSLHGPYFFDDLQAFGGDLDHVPFPDWSNWLAPQTRPLVQVWFWLIGQFSSTPRFGYRIAGLFIHLVNASMLWMLIRSVQQRLGDEKLRADGDAMIRHTVTALWLSHPVCVAAIASIVQQSELLMSAAVLVYLWIIATTRDQPSLLRLLLLYGCLLFGTQAKVVMLAAVPAGWLLDSVLRRESLIRTLRSRWLFHGMPIAIGGVASLILIPMLLRGDGGVGFGGDAPPVATYLLAELEAFAVYFKLVFWPENLSIDRGPNWDLNLADVAPTLMFVVAYVVAAIYLLRRPHSGRFAFFGWLMLMPILLLAPTSTIVPTADPIFEHRIYLAAAFVLWFIAELVRFAVFHRMQLDPRRSRIAVGAVVVAALLGFALRMHSRAEDYASVVSLWRTSLDVDPDNARAAQNFVAATQNFGDQRRLEEDLIAIMQAADARGHNFDPIAHQLAKEYLRRGRADEAATILRRLTIKQPPIERMLTSRQRREFGEVWFDFGVALAGLGDPASGASAVEMALRITPGDPFAHALAGDLHESAGKHQRAVEHWRSAIQFHDGPWLEIEAKLYETSDAPMR